MSITSFRGNYVFLSNFYAVEYTYKDIKFKNSEQTHKWEKTSNDYDKEKVLDAKTAVEVKRIGHSIKVDIKVWDAKS